MRVAPSVSLAPEERATLQTWQSAGRTPRAVRARIVLLAARGLQDREIAGRLRVSRRTAAQWRARFLHSGLRGLADRAPAIRRGRVREETIQAIVRSSLDRSAPGGWSSRALARRFGVSHMTVRRVWSAYGVRPARHASYPVRADPAAARVPWDIIGLYLDPPSAALVVTLHAPLPGLGANPPGTGGGDPPSSPAMDPWRLVLDAVGSGLVPGAEPSRGDGPALRFLAMWSARGPETPPARVVAAGPEWSASASLARWRVRHPSVEFELLSGMDAWRTRATETLRVAGRRPRPRGRFQGPAELAHSVAGFLRTYRAGAGPFVWAAAKKEVAAGEAAYRLRHDLAVTEHPGFRAPGRGAPGGPSGGVGPDRLREMARTVLRRYLRVDAHDRLTIESWTATLPYSNAMVLEALKLGARPLVLYEDEPTYWAATSEVPARNLGSIGEHRRAAIERSDVFVSFLGPSDRERFHSLTSALLSHLSAFQDASFTAAAKGGARTVSMAIGRVSPASARMYGVDLDAWQEELVGAACIDPAVLRRRGRALAERLSQGRELEVRHPNGTRLSLRLAGRPALVSDGRIPPAGPKEEWALSTLPAGVVMVPVDETYAEGVFRSNVASSVGVSDTVGGFSGGQWTFRAGHLTGFRYDGGSEFFEPSYRKAPAGKDRPGYLSIGLNDRLRIAPLLEDQGLGTITLNIGRNDHVGGRSRTPWWAWLFLTGGTLFVDGAPVVRDGSIVEGGRASPPRGRGRRRAGVPRRSRAIRGA